MRMKFRIDNWSAWTETRSSPEQWVAWSRGQDAGEIPTEPDTGMVPAMQRRRMSRFSKIMVSTAIQCIGEIRESPLCVFATRHGELTRTLKIIGDIVSGRDVSPTDFSMSVHNTALGLYSMFSKNKLPSTLVVAGQDTFCSAMLEASIFLDRFPGNKVLLVYADEPVPEPLVSFDELPKEAISLALLLSASSDPRDGICLKLTPNDTEQADNICLAQYFLQFFLSRKPGLICRTQRNIWEWSRL